MAFRTLSRHLYLSFCRSTTSDRHCGSFPAGGWADVQSGTRDRWNEAGHLDMETRALIAAKELLATWEPEPLPEEACARVRAVLNAAESDYGVPESLE